MIVMASPSEAIASFVVKTEYGDIPPDVVQKAKMITLDTIGTGLGGSKSDLGKISYKAMKSLGGKEESTVVGERTKLPCTSAAFANAARMNALDYDDVSFVPFRFGHIATTIVSAALSFGDRVRASGKDLIVAVALGYEVAHRVGAAIQSPIKMDEIYGTGTWQSLGAAASVGKYMNLDEKGMRNAIGIAATASPIPAVLKTLQGIRPFSWLKDQATWGALAGVYGALLAQAGFVGGGDVEHILDGEKGFWKIVGSDRCDFDLLTRNLGKEYLLMTLAFKNYPSCSLTHSTLTAIDELRKKYEIKAEDIKQVTVKHFDAWAVDHFAITNPSSMIDAEFCLPYLVAIKIIGDTPGPNWYTQEKLNDSRILTLAEKVRLELDPDAAKEWRGSLGEKAPSTVIITTKGGQILTESVQYPRGTPPNPMTSQELESKFLHLASFVLGQRKREALLKMLLNLEDLDNINKLTALLSPSK